MILRSWTGGVDGARVDVARLDVDGQLYIAAVATGDWPGDDVLMLMGTPAQLAVIRDALVAADLTEPAGPSSPAQAPAPPSAPSAETASTAVIPAQGAPGSVTTCAQQTSLGAVEPERATSGSVGRAEREEPPARLRGLARPTPTTSGEATT